MKNYIVKLPFLFITLISLSLFANGVGESRVALPDGPGSIEGIGDNVDINPNMGSMSYSVPVGIPDGFSGATPGISLSYSSSAGSSVAGIGWSLSGSSIERLTLRGLPEYDADDEFAADGGTQLVRVKANDENSDYSEYRARFEGGFARYRWYDDTNGKGGYWRVEYPDGSMAFYGADSNGNSVATARSGKSATEIFRYYLVETVDVYGHKVKYSYKTYDNYPLQDKIEYLFKKDGTAKYEISFDYEAREDKISDCKAGYEELLSYRVTEIKIKSSDYLIKRYVITYEDMSLSGGLSRIAKVDTYGRNDEKYPIVYSFTYSDGLGDKSPFITDMGTIDSSSFISGKATLIDINGDALPDIVNSGETGEKHTFFINRFSSGTFTFESAVTSGVEDSKNYKLATASVQILDINGDGFSDLINKTTKQALLNKGNGDWDGVISLTQPDSIVFEDDDDDATGLQDGEQLKNIRFFDYNNDRKIDILRSTDSQTTVYENTGSGFAAAVEVDHIGYGFDSEKLQLSDMNGDGMLDPVYITEGSDLLYRLNYGWGKWSEWKTIPGFNFQATDLPYIELEDINGDGLSDIVIQKGNEVKYALNKNGASFQEIQTLTGVSGIPTRDADTTVMYADMNGNGSTDILWIANNKAQFLEMFPESVNLVKRIENNIGMVTEVDYSSSVEEMAADAIEWKYKLPHSNIIVKEQRIWEEISKVVETTSYSYHHGYYDGTEKEFRGYEAVERQFLGDQFQESGLYEIEYNVGMESTYYKGLIIFERNSSNDKVINETAYTYKECGLDGLPAEDTLKFPIKMICNSSVVSTIIEGESEDKWVRLKEDYEYDGYGNVTSTNNRGVISIGGKGCDSCETDAFGKPCGSTCLGDEEYEETYYVPPSNVTSGKWILHTPYKKKTYGTPNSDMYTETVFYYDGEPFTGLDEGKMSIGNVTRITDRINSANEIRNRSRVRVDEHGNIIEELSALATIGGLDHKRTYTIDEYGINILSSNMHLTDAEGNPYTLTKRFTYDPVWNKPASSTNWIYVVDGKDSSQAAYTYMSYDNMGRITSIVSPGNDTLESPTVQFTYELSNPTSRVIIKSRTESGKPFDTEKVACMDGLGRTFQKKTKLENGIYLASGFKKFNRQGSEYQVYLPYESSSNSCDTEPPSDIIYTQFYRDATYRVTKLEKSDSDLYGTNSTVEKVYKPLMILAFDEQDTDQDSPHYNTPEVSHLDGLGRTYMIERTKTIGTFAKTELTYDSLGNVRGFIDDMGNEKVQTYDMMNRIISINDPNGGVTTFEYDDADNIVRRTDARDETIVMTYDGTNRPLQKWIEGKKDTSLIEYSYDKSEQCSMTKCTYTAGQLVETTYPIVRDGKVITALESFGYDARENKIYGGISLDLDYTFEISTKYDNMDRIVSTTYPNGKTINYTFDAATRPLSIGEWISNITYTENSETESVTYQNGVKAELEYDALNRLSGSKLLAKDGNPLFDIAYKRDRISHITEITDNLEFNSEKPYYGAQYEYDSWKRLTKAIMAPGTDQEETISYSYDTLDNITSKTSSLEKVSPAHRGTFKYEGFGPNSVSDAGALQYSYDSAGFTTEKSAQSFEYDAFGRLSTSEKDGTTIARFTYASDTTRVIKEEGNKRVYYIGNDYEVRNGIAYYYIRLGNNRAVRIHDKSMQTELYTDRDSDNMISAYDAFLNEQEDESNEETGLLLASSVERLLLTDESDATFFFHDHLGSILISTDDSGSVVGQQGFYPYGAMRKEKSGFVDFYGFTGQERDETTGLIRFESRYFDTDSGRWHSIDPLFAHSRSDLLSKMGESTTAYAYVKNSAVNYSDENGTMALLEIGGGLTYDFRQGARDIIGGDGGHPINFVKWNVDRGKGGNASVYKDMNMTSGGFKKADNFAGEQVLHIMGHGKSINMGEGALQLGGLFPTELAENVAAMGFTGRKIVLFSCNTGKDVSTINKAYLEKGGSEQGTFAQAFANEFMRLTGRSIKVVAPKGKLNFNGDGKKPYRIDGKTFNRKNAFIRVHSQKQQQSKKAKSKNYSKKSAMEI